MVAGIEVILLVMHELECFEVVPRQARQRRDPAAGLCRRVAPCHPCRGMGSGEWGVGSEVGRVLVTVRAHALPLQLPLPRCPAAPLLGASVPQGQTDSNDSSQGLQGFTFRTASSRIQEFIHQWVPPLRSKLFSGRVSPKSLICPLSVGASHASTASTSLSASFLLTKLSTCAGMVNGCQRGWG